MMELRGVVVKREGGGRAATSDSAGVRDRAGKEDKKEMEEMMNRFGAPSSEFGILSPHFHFPPLVI